MPGTPEPRTRDYAGHGVTNRLAAFNIYTVPARAERAVSTHRRGHRVARCVERLSSVVPVALVKDRSADGLR
jgi:hypothetical protein